VSAALLQGAVVEAVARWFDPGATLDPGSFAVTERPWSFGVRFRAVTGAGVVDCIGKVPRWEEAPTLADVLRAGPQPNVLAEYRTLVEIERGLSAAGDDGLCAVVPVGISEPHNLIVTRVLDAVPLRRLPRFGARFGEAARRAGRWLRWFHDGIGGVALGEFPGSDLVDRVGGLLPDGGAPPGWEPAAAAVIDRIQAVAGRPVRIGDLHGDANTANVLVLPDGRVAMLDPNRRRGPVTEDVAHLAGEIILGRARAASGGMLPGGAAAQRAVRSLIGGYRLQEVEVFDALLRLDLLERWADLEARLGPVVLSPIRRHLRRRIEAG